MSSRKVRESPVVTVGTWVLVAPISSRALKLYCLLSARTTPPADVLIELLDLNERSELDPLLDELIAIGALDNAGDHFVVHQTPPEDYAGPMSMADYLEATAAVRGERG